MSSTTAKPAATTAAAAAAAKAPAPGTAKPGAAANDATTRTRARRRGAPAGSTSTPGGRVRHRPGGSPITLTGRGGVVVIFAASLLGALIGRPLDITPLPGIAFILGCAAAALLTRQADILTLSVCPPAVFFVVTLFSEVIGALGDGSMVRSVLLGVFGTLAQQAPSLFLGTALVIGILIPRGLPANLRELRTRLAGARRLSDLYDEDPVRWNETPGPRAQHRESP